MRVNVKAASDEDGLAYRQRLDHAGLLRVDVHLRAVRQDGLPRRLLEFVWWEERAGQEAGRQDGFVDVRRCRRGLEGTEDLLSHVDGGGSGRSPGAGRRRAAIRAGRRHHERGHGAQRLRFRPGWRRRRLEHWTRVQGVRSREQAGHLVALAWSGLVAHHVRRQHRVLVGCSGEGLALVVSC